MPLYQHPAHFFRMELFLCAKLRSVKDTQKPQLYLHRQLWWQSPLLNVQRIRKYCSSPLSRVALKASISIKDSGSESSHYTQFTENMQLDIFPSDSQTVGHTVRLLPLLDCSLNLYTLSDEVNLTWSICSFCKILCIMWTVVSGIISVHCSVQNTIYELALTLTAGAYYKISLWGQTSISCLACLASIIMKTYPAWYFGSLTVNLEPLQFYTYTRRARNVAKKRIPTSDGVYYTTLQGKIKTYVVKLKLTEDLWERYMWSLMSQIYLSEFIVQ